jgi:hypothetical protein
VPTLDASSPAAVYGDTSATTSLVTASFTPPSGSIVVAKVCCADASLTSSTPTATGLTFTSRINTGLAGSSTRDVIYTATGAGSAVTVTAAFGGTAGLRALIVEVWTSAQLAATPATHSPTLVPSSGAPTDSLTTVAAGSVVSWLNGDWAAVDGTSRAYRTSATEKAYHFITGQYTVYAAYQTAGSAGAQTYGLTAPAAETYILASIEIQASAGVTANPTQRAIYRTAVHRSSNF